MLATFLGKKEVSAEEMADYVSAVPLGRLNGPEDVAYAAVFLASDEASMISAATGIRRMLVRRGPSSVRV